MLVKDINPEYFPKSNQSFDVPHRKLDTVHYIRKKPTKKMKRVKNFLDKQELNNDLNKVQLDQNLSELFSKFDHLKRVRDANREKRMKRRALKSVPLQKNFTTDMTNFLEYHEYVEMFAKPESNLWEKIRPKPGQNAETFIRVYKEHRDKKLKYINDMLPSRQTSVVIEKKFVRNDSKQESKHDSSSDMFIQPDENLLNETAPLVPLIETNQVYEYDPYRESFYEKPKRILKVLETPELIRLKEKSDNYTQYRPPEAPKLAEYDLMGSKRTKALQLTYYRKLGILDALRIRTPQKDRAPIIKNK